MPWVTWAACALILTRLSFLPRLRLDQAASDRVAREFDAVAHAEFFEHVRAMSVDCLDADDEHRCDRFGCVAFGDQLQYLELAWCEEVEVISALIGSFD